MILRAANAISLISASGIVIGQIPSIPDDLSSWPVQAILGLVTISSLVVTCFVVKKMSETDAKKVDAIEHQAKALNDLSVQLAVQNQLQLEMNARLNVRPCLMKAP